MCAPTILGLIEQGDPGTFLNVSGLLAIDRHKWPLLQLLADSYSRSRPTEALAEAMLHTAPPASVMGHPAAFNHRAYLSTPFQCVPYSARDCGLIIVPIIHVTSPYFPKIQSQSTSNDLIVTTGLAWRQNISCNSFAIPRIYTYTIHQVYSSLGESTTRTLQQTAYIHKYYQNYSRISIISDVTVLHIATPGTLTSAKPPTAWITECRAPRTASEIPPEHQALPPLAQLLWTSKWVLSPSLSGAP